MIVEITIHSQYGKGAQSCIPFQTASPSVSSAHWIPMMPDLHHVSGKKWEEDHVVDDNSSHAGSRGLD